MVIMDEWEWKRRGIGVDCEGGGRDDVRSEEFLWRALIEGMQRLKTKSISYINERCLAGSGMAGES